MPPVFAGVVVDDAWLASIGIVSTLPSTYPTVISARCAVLGRIETVTLMLSEGDPLMVGFGRDVVFFGVDKRERRSKGDRDVEAWKGFSAAWMAATRGIRAW